jgi:hypothetical protein
MTVVPKEQLRNMPFVFQHCMEKKPRVLPAELGRKTGVCRKTAKRHFDNFMETEVLFPPQMRLKINKQIVEYVYLLKVTDVEAFVPVLEAEKFIFYYCLLGGSYNLIFMSYKPIDLSHLDGYRKTVASGVRSNYCVPSVENRSFCTAYQEILDGCNRKIVPSMLDMKLENFRWTKELWELYCDLKYDLRINYTPLVRKYEFKESTFYERVDLLKRYCDIYVPLYPEKEPNYTSFYFLIKTDCQQLVVECFGQLPVFTIHVRVKDYLLSYVSIPHGKERGLFRNVLSVLQRRGIIDSYKLSIAYWSDRINNHPGMPPPPPPPPPPSGLTPLDNGETGKSSTSFM